MMVFIEAQRSRPTLSFVSLASDTENQRCINEFNCRCQDTAMNIADRNELPFRIVERSELIGVLS